MTTTTDCRNFLAKTISEHPFIVLNRFDDQESKDQVLSVMANPNKWKRHSKWKAKGNHEFAKPGYLTYNHSQFIPAEELMWVREFYLNPNEFENAIGFQVLEDVNGNLILGQDIGD